MAKMSNRHRHKILNKVMYCKATGDIKQATDLLKTLLKDEEGENKKIGLWFKKLKSSSFVTVPQRARVTKSNSLGHYLQGDYYYSDLNCVFQRA